MIVGKNKSQSYKLNYRRWHFFSERVVIQKGIPKHFVYQVRGDEQSTKLFEFMSNYITGSKTGVEVSQAMTGIEGEKGLNFVTTGHMNATEPGMTYLLNGQLLNGYTIRKLNHSHPYTPNPSKSDIRFSSQISNIMKQRHISVPAFNIYYVPKKQKIPFGK